MTAYMMHHNSRYVNILKIAIATARCVRHVYGSVFMPNVKMVYYRPCFVMSTEVQCIINLRNRCLSHDKVLTFS